MSEAFDMSNRGRRDELVDVEAECSIIGTLLTEAPMQPQLLSQVAERMVADDFAVQRHAQLFRALLEFRRAPETLNELSLCQSLKESGHLVEVGGPAGLMEVLGRNKLVAGLGLWQQVAVVVELSRRRRGRAVVRTAGDDFANLARPVERVALEASSKLAALGRATVDEVPTGADALEEVIKRSDAAQRGEVVKLVRTNIRAWDEVLGGMPLGELTVIGGQPGGGKSTLLGTMLRSIAEGSAEQEPLNISLHSLEDSRHWAPGRHLAAESGLSLRQLYTPGLTPEQLRQRNEAADRLWEVLGRTHIDDKRGQTVHQVAAKASQLVATRGVRVVLVDHLLEMVDFNDERRQDERVGEILRVLRELAGDCNVAVGLAAHLRRPKDDGIGAQYQKPTLQAFAGSSYVERMARMAVGLWYPKVPTEPRAMPVAQPKVPKRATPNEAQAIHEAWQEARRKAEAEYQKARGRWESMRELASTSLIASALKVTEGPGGVDFTLRRILTAGLVDAKESAGNLAALGYTGE